MIVGKEKARRMDTVLDRLKAEEAHQVLSRLLAAHLDLRAEAEGIARSLLREVNLEAIADGVEEVRVAGVVDFRDALVVGLGWCIQRNGERSDHHCEHFRS